MKGLMIWGTTSDAGKSYIVTGLCRALANRGIRVAPFKGQNMSNNSYVTLSGHEIGRSQGLQAEAARVPASVHMNPVLLKPRSDRSSEVIIQGISQGSPGAAAYRKDFFQKAKEAVRESLSFLEKEYDVVLMEGAGSPAEINLMDKDLANLETAEIANVPALLAADIERGGVFASITGTLHLLPEDHRKRVKGLIVNRFRGDPSLFQQGITWLEQHTNVPVNGVLPMLDIRMEQEDSLSFQAIRSTSSTQDNHIDIAVIRLPYVSNYTDVEPFTAESDVTVRIVQEAKSFGDPDVILIPGTRSTMNDLKSLFSRGIVERIHRHAKQGGYIVGICGGFQMLCERLIDDGGSDTGELGSSMSGIQLFPLKTHFLEAKKTIQWKGRFARNSEANIPVSGFEIHTGVSHGTYGKEWEPLFYSEENEPEGIRSKDYKWIGTYIHHLFHNDEWRAWWLNQIRRDKGIALKPAVPYSKNKEKRFDELAEAVEEHLNIDEIIHIMEKRI